MKHFFILLFALVPLFRAVGQDSNSPPHLEPMPPLLELQAVAKSNDIPLAGFDPVTATNILPGDSLTALITLHQKHDRLTQWLVYFDVVGVSNQPSSQKPKPVVLYNAIGDKFEFEKVPVAFRIRTIGPFVNSASFWGAPTPKDDSGRASVNGTFLVLGLDKCMAVLYRLDTNDTENTNNLFETADKPFPAATVKENQKLAAPLRVTLEGRRALAAAQPTLVSYFTAVGETPDLEGIMWKVISLPSVWSLVKHVGVSASLGIDTDDIRPMSLPRGWNLPGHDPAWPLRMSLSLNGKPALDVALLVTSPNPSLAPCGGIFGFVAQNPDDPQNYLTLRVISTQRNKSVETLKR